LAKAGALLNNRVCGGFAASSARCGYRELTQLLINAEIGVLRRFRPLRHFAFQICGEVLRRATERFITQRDQALSQSSLTPTVEANVQASVLVSFVVGRLQRFARSGYKRLPTEYLDASLALLT